MKLKHYDHDGRARFVTFCTHRKIPVLSQDMFRQTVLDSILECRDAHRYELLGYVIMPEHVHLVLVPGEGNTVGTLMGEIKRISAKVIHGLMLERGSALLSRLTVVRNWARRFVLWQRRCHDRNCRSDTELWEAVRYCHNNPVKRGLVADPARWKWSSYSWYED